MAEQDELSILEEAESATEPARVWLGAAVAAVLLIGLTMAVLAIGVLVAWAVSYGFSLAVPRLPGL